MRIDIKGVIIPNDEKWIYDYFEVEATCPKDVNSKLEEAAGGAVDVHINSEGGSVFDGSEIYSALRSYNGKVKIHIDGLAASAASVIACAAKSEIAPTAMIMVHNVSSCAKGDWHDMDKESEILKKANEAVAAAYIYKSGMSMDEALEMMNAETWLTADEAVTRGLCDEISEANGLKLVAGLGDGVIPQSVIKKMQAQRLAEREGRKNALNIKLNNLKNGGINHD